MAEATLNFDEAGLDHTTSLYALYSRLYEGMVSANSVEAPDFSEPPLTETGEVDTATVEQKLSEYSTILMKNSAYMMANSIVSTVGSGGGGGSGGEGYLSRNGDSMTGRLTTLYGFQAGYNNQLIFETIIGADERKKARVSGCLFVDEDAEVTGKLNLTDSGIFLSNKNVLFYGENTLNICSENVRITGAVILDGSFTTNHLAVNGNGAFYDDYEFYHQGNCNSQAVDWNMRNGHVYGTFQADGEVTVGDRLTALQGFRLGSEGKALFYTDSKEDGTGFIRMMSDLSLGSGYGITFNDTYIVQVRNGAEHVVSFSAPGMVLNLGDSDGETATTRIALQTGIYNYNSDYRIISPFGDGNFPNSFSAGCGNSGPAVIQTYYQSGENCGIVLKEKLRFGNASGPILKTVSGKELVLEAPFVHVANDLQQTDFISGVVSYKPTTSLFRDQSLAWSASLHFDTDAEFFTFNRPAEAAYFAIKSEEYKTRLSENTLFFDDGIFLEGVTGGILHTGDAHFAGSLISKRFAESFAGYGWGIREDRLYGGVTATFDSLTIRKKLRIYELEVQKSSSTNGSLWISDSCSGDYAEEIM